VLVLTVGVREDAPWLLQNWVDGVPPLGWHDTAGLCVCVRVCVCINLYVYLYIRGVCTPLRWHGTAGMCVCV